MPTQGRPKFTIRKDELVEEFIAACPPKEEGGAAQVVREYMAFHLRRRGANLPDRPPKQAPKSASDD